MRGTPTSTTSNGWQGYIGTVYVACNNGNNLLALNTDNMNNVNLTSAPFNPGTGFHTYRVEVRGNEVSLLDNGTQIGSASSQQTDTLSNGSIKFDCTLVILRVSNLHILTL